MYTAVTMDVNGIGCFTMSVNNVMNAIGLLMMYAGNHSNCSGTCVGIGAREGHESGRIDGNNAMHHIVRQ